MFMLMFAFGSFILTLLTLIVRMINKK
ncbi:putative holin-like toxin [Virgibacillus kimchii]